MIKESGNPLATGIDDARMAYLELEAHVDQMSDRDLARSDSYARLLRAALTLESLGGVVAVNQAMVSIFPDDPARAELARKRLARLWYGIGSWTAPEWLN